MARGGGLEAVAAMAVYPLIGSALAEPPATQVITVVAVGPNGEPKPGSRNLSGSLYPTWTVKVGQLGSPNEHFPPPQTRAVTTAWLAGNATPT
ncbi:hypothetical protein [Mycobacterium noviomagense]|uniref:Uncharacterized protein n=1 Tax=Mycobacterium noviomagense TaxID=459858 RepID=A0A7I7P882_9MYCO|nr:hypothetical protein [Mycobacterium noviomagense]BBY04830.1 hypothetical protein MNVI_01480 [Mycobacterium noviomagense]